MNRKLWLSLAAAVILTVGPVGVAGATGADRTSESVWRHSGMLGRGWRGSIFFRFNAVVISNGQAAGWFNSNLIDRTGVLVAGQISCGWVSGNVGVLGGLMAGADPGSPESFFTVMVSDGPDGIIIGTGRPHCDTTGFGVPGSLPITAGQITVFDR